MPTIQILTDQGVVVAAQGLAPKNFRTGSRGFYTNGKVVINGVRYQAQFQLVEIGSKPQTAPVAETKGRGK